MAYPLRPINRGDSPASVRYYRRKRRELLSCAVLGAVIAITLFLFVK